MEFVSVLVFLQINLFLGLRANRTRKTTPGSQAVGIYFVWSILAGAMIVATVTNHYHWQMADSITLMLNVVGAFTVYGIGYSYRLSINDSMVKGWLALVFKSIPQVMLAVTIWTSGSGQSLPATAVVVGHLTILMRLTQIWLATREFGWARAQRAMCLSEVGNEVSWVFVTISWLAASK
ncbi:MAG: hypothetical protein WAW92_02320 [Minisyncoccia bacterium]